MPDLSRAASIHDLRLMAKSRMPRFAFDFVDGGAESEANLRGNQAAFGEVKLRPKALVDVSELDLSVELFGQVYDVPFGKAPIGFLNTAWPGSDIRMARLAGRKRMAYGISTASSTPMERLIEAAEGYAWFQLYLSDDRDLVENLLGRAEAGGCEVLLATVDASVPGKRDRDIRNALQFPFRINPETLWQLATSPLWTLHSLAHGKPEFANLKNALDQSGRGLSLIEVQKRMISARYTWEDLARLRDRWRGKLILKGIMTPEDAEMAIEAGADGILVSNHGGRQMDYGPASIEALPLVARIVNGRVPLLLDSGIRRGADIVRAKALGAVMALTGRSFAYGLAAGDGGEVRAFDILETELSRTLGQIGCPRFADAGPEILWTNHGG